MQEIKRRGQVLNKVHIQLDNTARDNKNKFVMSFCAWLVEMNLVSELRVGFMNVG